ncbi:hypothetical protein BCR23_14210 [Enterococcus quebecensis]|uniref:Uncharacterized protein n=1 Tax=Enterococcus quebecensis TaxID=903983 RepID=A0A1E5GZU7_9ENTE|nr:hypothetical protein BCR23_14210 [Enterococcus quebecensis]
MKYKIVFSALTLIIASFCVFFLASTLKIRAGVDTTVDTPSADVNLREGTPILFNSWYGHTYHWPQEGQAQENRHFFADKNNWNKKTDWYDITRDENNLTIIHKSAISDDNHFVVRGSFSVKDGNYYRLVMDIVPGDASFYTPIATVYNRSVYPFIERVVKETHLNVIFKGVYSSEYISFGSKVQYMNTRSKVVFKNIQLYDLGPVTLKQVKPYVDELFTDETHTELKSSVTQKKINEVKKIVNTLSTTSDLNLLTAEVSKAQALLNKINMTLTVSALGDNPKSIESRMISGKAYPKSFLSFSGTSSFPEGEITTGIDGDTIKYHLRADSEGNYSYSLPEGEHFKKDTTISVYSMLNGKYKTEQTIVKDTTPPEKPVLNAIKDTSQFFTGSAESGAQVKIYDAETKTVFIQGTSGADDQFSFTIPETQKPLFPYKQYYAIATDAGGNSSLPSDVKKVADTTPPKAEAVKQVLELGSPLPQVNQLVKNVSDNAGDGSDNITIELIKEPDIQKAGYKIAEVKVIDKAGNFVIVNVPVIVKDLDTTINETHLLQASNLTALAIDFPETRENQREFILQHAKVNAWDITTGELLTNELTIDYGSTIKEPGVYEINLAIGTLSKKIKVELLEGSIGFKDIPITIDFGIQTIKARRQEHTLKNNLRLTIDDSRFKKEKWRLAAQLSQPFTTSTGVGSTIDLIYRSYDLNNNHHEQEINELANTVIYQSDIEKNRLVELEFSKEKQKELVLTVSPGSVRSGMDYSTQIIWTLENGP